MKKTTILLLSFLFPLAILASPLRIVGYIQGDHLLTESEIEYAKKLTHIQYAFANIIDGELKFDPSRISNDEANIKTLKKIREKNPAVMIMISAGGWNWSGNFSDAAATEASREKFANSVIQFLDKYDLNGIDIAWIFPGMSKTVPYKKEDRTNYTLLLKKIREKYNWATSIDEKIKRRYYQLSILAGFNHNYYARTEMHYVHKEVDYINLMTFDFFVEWERKLAGHHTNLHYSWSDGEKRYAADSVTKMYREFKIPSRKIVMGAAFYGRVWDEVEDENNGLFQSARKADRFSIPYNELAAQYINKNGYERKWDKKAKAAYLWNKEKAVFISYDDKKSLRKKAAYVRKNRLGGIVIWEYSGDYKGQLTKTIRRRLNRIV